MRLASSFLDGFKEGMRQFGQTISGIINSALLLLAYIVGIGLTFIFAKAFKKHFLETKISKERNSYWSDLNLKKKPMDAYYRQF